MSSASLKPIYLFADSQLLFWREGETLFLESIRRQVDCKHARAAYVGASNGDRPDFYSIFQAAMEGSAICDCRMISSDFSSEDESFFNEADIILLAGGDVEKGWRVFERNGLKESIRRRHAEGALLIGISAGAMQLGLCGWPAKGPTHGNLFDTSKLVPFILAAHEEANEWRTLRQAVELLRGAAPGIGVRAGGGAIYYPDNSLEALRFPLHEFRFEQTRVTHSLLTPAKTENIQEATEVC